MYRFYSLLRFFFVLLNFITEVKLIMKTENIEIGRLPLSSFFIGTFYYSADDTYRC